MASPRVLLIAVLCFVPLHALAQTKAPAAATPVPVAVPAPAGEPAVRRNVVEDDNARIEELSVRGAVRSIRVQPKGPIKAEYEVLPIDAGRDVSDGPSSAKGAAGKRVWRVLTF